MKALEMSLYKYLYLGILSVSTVPAQDATTFSTDIRVVNLLVTVRDDRGHLVQNLTKDDFSIEENGRPQTIRYFSQESNLPLTLGLLIDTSISQRRLLREERTASYRFLEQVLRPDKDRAFVIHFDREVELLQDLTSSPDRLDRALAQLETPRRDRRRGGPDIGRWAQGGTELYDSVLLASDEIMRRQTGRKALILLTDGVDNGSKIGLARAIESAQRVDTLVYSILFSDRQAYDGAYANLSGKNVLGRISRETGGNFFEVSASQPISTIYAQLQEELRNQYSIGYTPDSSAGTGFRRIRVATRSGLAVVTRTGYFAGR
jgi:VWFA-related protein